MAIRHRMRRTAIAAACVALIGALTACSGGPEIAPVTITPPRPTGASSAEPVLTPVQPAGEPVEIATDLDAPWSILRLPSGATLVSERDDADVLELLPDGSSRVAGEVDGVDPGGEGGLLGLAFLPDGDGGWVYAYFTGADDNRIVRMPLTGAAGSLGLGAAEVILSGIAKAGNHNGGRIAFGPDGMLYATAGDAGDPDAAQDPSSLNGKILRMTSTGAVPPDNPSGSLMWTLGHRNPQGIAWDSHGRMFSSEFGQNTWDELNLITAGANYGWPVVEGVAGDPRFVDPIAQWNVADASPSGLAIVSDTLFMASLRGQRIWSVQPDTGREPAAFFTEEYGRIRDVTEGPGGTLWFITNNTDGRGDPSGGDDRLYQVALAPVG